MMKLESPPCFRHTYRFDSPSDAWMKTRIELICERCGHRALLAYDAGSGHWLELPVSPLGERQ